MEGKPDAAAPRRRTSNDARSGVGSDVWTVCTSGTGWDDLPAGSSATAAAASAAAPAPAAAVAGASVVGSSASAELSSNLRAAWRRTASSARPTVSSVSTATAVTAATGVSSSSRAPEGAQAQRSARKERSRTDSARRPAPSTIAEEEPHVPMCFRFGIHPSYEPGGQRVILAKPPPDGRPQPCTGGVNVDLDAQRVVNATQAKAISDRDCGMLAQLGAGSTPHPSPRPMESLAAAASTEASRQVEAGRRGRAGGLRQQHYYERQAVGVAHPTNVDRRKPQERHPLPLTQAHEVGWYAEQLQQQHWGLPGYRWRSSKPKAPLTAMGPMDVTSFALAYREYAKKHPFDAPPFSSGNFRYGGCSFTHFGHHL